MILAKTQDDIETFFCKQNQVESCEPKFPIVLNVQVSDTTGDAMKSQWPGSKNSITKIEGLTLHLQTSF